MDLRGSRRSSNIEDRRGFSVGRTGVGLSLGGVLFLVVLSFFGINPLPYLGMATKSTQEAPQQQSAQPYQESPEEAKLNDLAGKVLGETEQTWGKFFGGKYEPTTMVLFNGIAQTACGTGQAAMGPFYCPNDRKVYLDLSFFQELDQRFGVGGDFAQAYVIAHEVGHHVQNLLGKADEVHSLQESAGNRATANKYSVMLELQADCYAGIWAADAAPRLQLNPGDIEEALRAATAIGDDRLQRQSQGVVVPDSFTHGSSEQRVRWLKRGMESGDPKACDTFDAAQL
jgi:predicted metalloprotease